MNRLMPQVALAAFVAVAACSDPNELQDATLTNVVDTVTLWSQTLGPVNQPSAYSLASRNAVRTWEAGINFEFVFDEDSTGQPVLVPIDALGLLPSGAFKPGLKRPADGVTFDGMTRAPRNGYLVDAPIPLVVGDRFFIRSTVSSCSFLGVPLYGKLEVLAIDSAAHTASLQMLANQNCGYRSLNPGIPKQ